MIRSFTRILFALTALLAAVSHAQVNYTGGVYSQNFDTLPGTTNNTLNEAWTDNTTLAGWYASKTTFSVTNGTIGGTATTFNPTTAGNDNNVGLFSFGTAASADRALGSRATTTSDIAGNDPVLYGVKLVNNSGATLTKFTIIYTGEQWFKSTQASAHTLSLDYQLGAADIISGSWTAVSAGAFTGPISAGVTATALDGNAVANRRVIVAVVSGISWAPGQSLWIRFRDAEQTGFEQGLAVDDFAFLADTELGLFFNGSTSFVTMGAATATLGAGSFTIECRFLKTGAGVSTTTGGDGITAIPLVTKGRNEGEGSTTDCNYFLGIDANGKLVADFEQLNATNNGTAYAAGQNFPVTGSTTLQNGVWYHVAATYDTTTAVWKLYVNGVAETLSTPLPTFVGVVPRSDSTQHFGIGSALSSLGAAAGFFQGCIDEVRVWNYARSSAEIIANIETKITAGVTGLLGRYGLDAGSGTTATGITASGAAPNGALSGTTLPQWVNTKAFANSPNIPPTVSLTSPTDSSTFDQHGLTSVSINASASDSDGSVAKVEFYSGSTKLGEDSAAPYTYSFPSTFPSGSYTFTARALDNAGGGTTSAAINVTITNINNFAPTISLSSPVNYAAHTAGSTIPITAAVSDSDGAVTKVQFYLGATLLNEDTSSPFSYTWPSPSVPGNYTFSAVATDNDGATATTSASVTITLVTPQYSYSQNFDSMGNGTTLPSGWSFFGTLGGDPSTWTDATGIPANSVAGGTSNATLIAATTYAGTSDTSGYNYALTGSTSDRALGTSPNTAKGTALQLSLTNTSGVPLNSIRLGYNIRRFAAGSVDNELPGYQVFYSLDNGTTWTNVAALNPTLSGPDGVIVPNTVGVTTASQTTISLTSTWASNATLLLRWVDDNAGQSSPDQVIGLDNVAVSAAELLRGPYLQMAAPAQMTIRWRSLSSFAGRVQFGTTFGNLNQTVDEQAATTEHSVKLTGLTPNTTYFYSIGSATETFVGDESLTFTTPPTAGTSVPTRIWIMGDAGTTGNNPSETRQKAVRDAFYTWTGTRTPNLVLQLGDNAYNLGLDTEFQAGMFDIYPSMLRKTPFWSCLGNHEVYGTSPYPYFSIYTLPTAGEAGGVSSGTENYYSFDYGNIHFICLDSMISSRAANGAMAQWLQNDLASTAATWIICFFHHPPYTKGSHDSDNGILNDPDPELVEMRENIVPILEAGGVDLVLSGHSHSYERSKLIDGHYGYSNTFVPSMFKNAGNGRETGVGATGAYTKDFDAHRGAVYTVAGSSGKTTIWTSGSNALVNPAPHPVMNTSLLTLGSVVLDINENRLDAKFISSTGTVDDYFTLIKEGNSDSDADGIPDEYEIAHGLNRHISTDAILDGDNDGAINRDEFVLGLNSLVPDRYNFTTTRNAQTGAVTVTFPTIPARNYRVWYSDTLTTWNPASSIISGTGSNQVWVDDGSEIPAATGNRRFYKVVVTTAQ